MMKKDQEGLWNMKQNPLYSILFGGALGGIVALFFCTLILMGKYMSMSSSTGIPKPPPFIIFFGIFVLMVIGGAAVAHQRMKRKSGLNPSADVKIQGKPE